LVERRAQALDEAARRGTRADDSGLTHQAVAEADREESRAAELEPEPTYVTLIVEIRVADPGQSGRREAAHERVRAAQPGSPSNVKRTDSETERPVDK
jgi:hypothetical protein